MSEFIRPYSIENLVPYHAYRFKINGKGTIDRLVASFREITVMGNAIGILCMDNYGNEVFFANKDIVGWEKP